MKRGGERIPDHSAAYAAKQAVAVILAVKEKFLLASDKRRKTKMARADQQKIRRGHPHGGIEPDQPVEFRCLWTSRVPLPSTRRGLGRYPKPPFTKKPVEPHALSEGGMSG